LTGALDVFDEIVGAVPPDEIKAIYLIGWKEHMRFTGFSREVLLDLISSTDIPVGDLDGRKFSHRATLKAWLDVRAKRDPRIPDKIP
jgi:hypothetical protein